MLHNPNRLIVSTVMLREYHQSEINNRARMIQECGYIDPITINGQTVISGALSVLAARQLKLKEVPCVHHMR